MKLKKKPNFKLKWNYHVIKKILLEVLFILFLVFLYWYLYTFLGGR